MTCLIWRQHRGQVLWTIVTVAALCALIVSFGLSAEHWLAGYHSWLGQLAAAGCPPPNAHSGVFHVNSPATCLALKDRYPGGLQPAFVSRYNFAILLSQYGLPAVFAITGAIIGAPLVAREVEQRTHLAAWTQSVSRRRWYAAKISALACGLAMAGLIAGTVNAWLQHQLALVLVRVREPGPGRIYRAAPRRPVGGAGPHTGQQDSRAGLHCTARQLDPRFRGRCPGPLPPGRSVLAATGHSARRPARPRRGRTGIGLARHLDTCRVDGATYSGDEQAKAKLRLVEDDEVADAVGPPA